MVLYTYQKCKLFETIIFMFITILSIAILILSVIIHEISHGYMADRLGDPTARLQGRLTLNPIKHLDPVGSFGWAKPVPYNPYNLKDKRKGEFLIAIAGPLSNIAIALVFSVIIRFVYIGTVTPFIQILLYIVIINIVLAIFNLVPIPPLDGSKLLFAFLPNQYGRTRILLETYAPILILVLIFFLWKYISPIIWPIFELFTGISTIR
jgi:Zn-dependent protease